jgi:hypothetical protein
MNSFGGKRYNRLYDEVMAAQKRRELHRRRDGRRPEDCERSAEIRQPEIEAPEAE